MTRSAGWISLLTRLGIHPLAAVAVVVVDWMLFGATTATASVGWLVSIPVGFVLGLAVALIQHRGCQEDPGLAAGKGLLIGLITAIPTAIPSGLTLGLGALGGIRMLHDRR